MIAEAAIMRPSNQSVLSSNRECPNSDSTLSWVLACFDPWPVLNREWPHS
jgi:hypothetical protein